MTVAYSELCQRHMIDEEKKEFEVFVVETNTAKVRKAASDLRQRLHLSTLVHA